MTTTSKLWRLGGKVVFWIDPVPAARPRVGKFGTYYPKKYAEFRKKFEKMIEAADLPEPQVRPVPVYLEFVIKKPKKPVNVYPMGDTDNYEKAVLDSMQGRAFFEDDKQVTLITGFKRYCAKGEEPHILMIVGDVDAHTDALQQLDTISLDELEE
jgi:Holliday junction resolvase RusA-like endonuclease